MKGVGIGDYGHAVAGTKGGLHLKGRRKPAGRCANYYDVCHLTSMTAEENLPSGPKTHIFTFLARESFSLRYSKNASLIIAHAVMTFLLIVNNVCRPLRACWISLIRSNLITKKMSRQQLTVRSGCSILVAA